jgi:hypothetical protein
MTVFTFAPEAMRAFARITCHRPAERPIYLEPPLRNLTIAQRFNTGQCAFLFVESHRDDRAFLSSLTGLDLDFIITPSVEGRVAERRNTDLQSVRPAEFYSAESNAPDRMSGGRTGHSPVFRLGNTP